MGLLGFAAKKAGAAVAKKAVGKVAEKVIVEKEEIRRFEFDHHMWIEKKGESKNAKSVVLDDSGNKLYTLKREKYNSDNPRITLLDKNGDTICVVALNRRFFSGEVDCNVKMNGKEILVRASFGFLENSFLDNLGYDADYKMNGCYTCVSDGSGNKMYIKEYIDRASEGKYFEYKDNNDMLIGFAYMMIKDAVGAGLKISG